jgi:hypothetical protein
MSDDIIQDLVSAWRERTQPRPTAAECRNLDLALCERWGGRRPYVCKWPPEGVMYKG